MLSHHSWLRCTALHTLPDFESGQPRVAALTYGREQRDPPAHSPQLLAAGTGQKVTCQAPELCVCCWPAAFGAQKCLPSLLGCGTMGTPRMCWAASVGRLGHIRLQVLAGHLHTQRIDFWHGKVALVS